MPLHTSEVYLLFFQSSEGDDWLFWNDYKNAKGVRSAINKYLQRSFDIKVFKVSVEEGCKALYVRR